jgi:hypothetical protein
VSAFDSAENELAKSVMGVGTKGAFKSIGTTLGTNITTSLLKKGIGTVAGGLDKVIPGLGGLLTGKESELGSSSSKPMHVVVDEGGMGGATLGAGGVDLSGMLGNMFGSASKDKGSSQKGSGGGIGGFFSKLLSFIPMLEGGGDVTPGKAYIVGEKKPELFVPGRSGRIVPNFASTQANSSTHIEMHIHGVTDMDSFKKSQTQITGMMGAAAQRSQQRLGR